MLLRMRRYRVYLIVAALTASTIYYVVNIRHASGADIDSLRHFGFGSAHDNDQSNKQSPEPPAIPAPPGPNSAPSDPENKVSSDTKSQSKEGAAPTLKHSTGQTSTAAAWKTAQTITGEELLPQIPKNENDLRGSFESTWDAGHTSQDDGPRSHWKPQKERFPIADEDLIRLPVGNAKPLAKIQFDFPSEKRAERSDRQKKQTAIREAFKHAWSGYEKYAMPHDELMPLTNSFSDSFMGWGATLIDALDTLWIMDMKQAFAQAVEEIKKIDFTTSSRKEIPMFETVIRILGGLISAYDLSEAQYPELLEKAVELANITMGAFDTPNRMPDMYYKWAPSYASQRHRSGTHVVLAELGSLSMEFTRLAQLTKQDKYYDAVARIQTSLEQWQLQTEMPGLWPLQLDASGCTKIDAEKLNADATLQSEKPILLDTDKISEQELLEGETPAKAPERKDLKSHRKRQADDAGSNDSQQDNESAVEKKAKAAEEDKYCTPQGLNYEPHVKKHVYAIGAKADSTYEYMPKMYRLLGGLSSQYEDMYRDAMRAIREHVLYRPMIEDERRPILFPAAIKLDAKNPDLSSRRKTIWEGSHLGCFAGGMVALGAKAFGISTDMEIAKQLTDGCVWAYESTPTKIMPELFELMPCENADSCPWDEAKWHKALDPKLQERMDAVNVWNKDQKLLFDKAGVNVVQDETTPVKTGVQEKPQPTVSQGGITKKFDSIVKREPAVGDEAPTKASLHVYDENDASLVSSGFSPKVALSHAKYVEARIQEERLPKGYTRVKDRSYILRPEAIESVFIMWRLTGDVYWREKGWAMFQAVQEGTHTEAGNAPLQDVTSVLGDKEDKMESFWLAETLKYFYLLFSEPSVINLDEYVLNTEAHPFRVPKL